MSSRPQASSGPVPGGSMAGLGGWERHTKGIGSKLLQKMGYKPGEGLGKNSDGRIDPVKLEANKGRSMLGANSSSKTRREESEESEDEEFMARGRRRRRRRAGAAAKRRGDDSADDGRDGSSDEEAGAAKFESDQSDQEEDDDDEEDEDSPEFVAKCLLASNEAMIRKLKEELQNERARQSMLKQTMAEYERDVGRDMETIRGYEDVLTLIKNLESVYRNDKLRISTLWQSLTSSISLTTRGHLIQIFALPLLRKQYAKIMIRNSSAAGDLLDLELESDLFGEMIDVAREWLKTKGNYPALIKWYLEWKTQLGLDRPGASKRRKYFRRKLLDVMHLATIKNERDLNSFHYVPYQESSGRSSARADQRDRYDREDTTSGEPQQPLSFKQLVEQRASERDLLFRPISNRNHESKQVYKLGQSTIYIDNKVVFVYKHDNRWQPQTLDDVIASALK